MRAGPRDKIRRTRRYSQRLIFNVRRASAVESPGRRFRALVVLGPIAISVLECIRRVTRAERGVGDSAADPLSDLRTGDSGWHRPYRWWRASLGWAWSWFAIHGSLVDLSRPSSCPSAGLSLYRGYPSSPGY